MTGIVITLLTISIIIAISIVIRNTQSNFYKRAELPMDIDTSIRGMLVELEDKGLNIVLSNESDEGKYRVRINSDNPFRYIEISEYILLLRDYLSLYNYSNLNVLYNQVFSLEFKNSQNMILRRRFKNKDLISDWIDDRIYLDYMAITFEVKSSNFEKFLTAKTTDTGPR